MAWAAEGHSSSEHTLGQAPSKPMTGFAFHLGSKFK